MKQTDAYLFKGFKNRTASWFKEFSGKLPTNTKSNPALYSPTRQAYVFRASSNAYDLYLQIGILCLGKPKIIFMEGSTDITKTAEFTPNKGPKGENFYVFTCSLRVLRNTTQCAVVTDSTDSCQFAYNLLKWENAVT